MIWRLPSEASPPTIRLRPRPAGVVLGRRRHQRSVSLHPKPLPLHPREAFVGQVRPVAIGGHEGLPYGPLVGGRRSQTESGDHAVGIYHQRRLEAVDPLGLGGAPAEGGLPAEEALARSSYPHDGRDEGGVHNAIDGRRLGELSGEGELQEAQLGLQGSDAPVELALRTQAREVGAQVRTSETPEVPLASEAGHWARMARVMTSGSLSRAGRPGFGGRQARSSFPQSSTRTYNETKKESRSMAAPSFGESLVHQHTIRAPSALA